MYLFERFWKNNQISNFMKIRQMEAEFSHADRETDRHDEANSSFAQFWRERLKGSPATSLPKKL
jgi:hypothetical protein